MEVDAIKGRISAFLTLAFVVFVLLLLAQTPALAHHKEGHDHGGGRGNSQKESSEEDPSGDEADREAGTNDEESGSDGDPPEGRDPSDDGSERSAEEQAAASGRAEDTDRRESTRSKDASGSTSNAGNVQGCDGSHHSDTGHGANRDGPDNPYHNTCDGSPSLNGSGTGRATGRPCAGCVGNADDKFPPGQAPDGSDHNNGYECDGNNGIGKTNPAHTGCRSAPPPPPPPPPPPCDADNNPANGIQPCRPSKPPKPPIPPRPPDREDRVLPKLPILPRPPEVVLQKGPTGILPRTGASSIVLVAVGLGLITAGVSTLGFTTRMRRRGRRKV